MTRPELGPDSTMTNATEADLAAAPAGRNGFAAPY